MEVSSDPRLVPGVGAAVELCACRSGLSGASCEDLKVAAEEAVRDTFGLLAGDGQLTVLCEAFADRVEVVLEHHGEALPTAGLDTFLTAGAQAASAGMVTGLSLLMRVDRVLYHTENGVSRTTLVKYLKGGTTGR